MFGGLNWRGDTIAETTILRFGEGIDMYTALTSAVQDYICGE